MAKAKNIEIPFMKESREKIIFFEEDKKNYLEEYQNNLVKIVDEYPTENGNRAEKIATFKLITEVNQYLKNPNKLE